MKDRREAMALVLVKPQLASHLDSARRGNLGQAKSRGLLLSMAPTLAATSALVRGCLLLGRGLGQQSYDIRSEGQMPLQT